MYFEKIVEGFTKLDDVEAIVLGGSRACGNGDEKSDYDLYLYCFEIPDVQKRFQILNDSSLHMELDNT